MNRDPEGYDGTKDPIYLLQRRVYTLAFCPKWLGYDGEYFWIEHQNILVGAVNPTEWNFCIKGEVDEALLFKYLCHYSENDRTAAIETWLTESVFLTREEAETYAKATEYNFEYGFRVYCVSCLGKLAKILNDAEEAIA